MANQEHVEILKQGVEVWNQWRERNSLTYPDLSRIPFGGDSVDISNINLSRADLRFSSLTFVNLSGANLSGANLMGTYLMGTNLRRAILCEASLSVTNLSGADLIEADFSNASLHQTIFGNVDLQRVKGLERVKHSSPSAIDIRTFYRSQGNIPEIFLRGAGVPDSFITYARSLVGKPIEYYSCFISYSNKDEDFVRRLYADLQSNNVRCWFAPEDLNAGDKFWHRIDESIHMYDKLLVVLSEHSVNSTWVENEVMAALEKEQENNKPVLFPIKLDETVIRTNLPWAANIRRTRHIGDFTRWKEHDEYLKALALLLRGLKAQ